jgi:hypothetical protein
MSGMHLVSPSGVASMPAAGEGRRMAHDDAAGQRFEHGFDYARR